MTIRIQSLELRDFRNHHELSIEPQENLTIILGNNAHGKTNVIEALQLVTMMSSFRSPQIEELVSWGHETASVSLHGQGDGRTVDIDLRLKAGQREYLFNGKKRKISEIKGTIPAVMFSPDDLNLVKGSSRGRRAELDQVGSQLSSTYGTIQEDYEKIVRQRNKLLKMEDISQAQLEAWNISLAHLGALFFTHRVHLFKKLKPFIEEKFEEIAPNDAIDIIYTPSWSSFLDERELVERREDVEELILRAITCSFKEEARRATSLIGPQKDEVLILVNGKDARRFASQGQQRTCALALKKAEVAFIHQVSGDFPILLLDDVMSELDETRRSALLQSLQMDIQTFITTTDLAYLDERIISHSSLCRLDEVGGQHG